jgi:putative oxidoreductase
MSLITIAQGIGMFIKPGARFWRVTMDWIRRVSQVSSSQGGILFIRLAVGLIFATQGVLKYTDPKMGVLRFAKIGFTHPEFTAHFVGFFEILCGILVLVGLFTRLMTVPLLAVICTAIATTKIPELWRPEQGFWFMVSDARTDFAMLCSLIFLVLSGPGRLSLDARLSRRTLDKFNKG